VIIVFAICLKHGVSDGNQLYLSLTCHVSNYHILESGMNGVMGYINEKTKLMISCYILKPQLY